MNGLKLVGSALLAGGLIAGTFMAGSMSAGGTSAGPEPTPIITVQEEPIITTTPEPEDTGSAPKYEVEQAEVVEPAKPQQEESAPAPQDPTPVVGTPVSVTPVPATPTPLPPTPEPAPQNDAPYVVSITPADGEIGVSRDANVVVNFSEPMDEGSVQAAFSLSTGNCGIFAWNSQATKVIFNPCSDWDYGEKVEVNIDDGAMDQLGLAMGHDFDSDFRIMRRIVTKIYSDPERDGHVYWSGYVSPDAQTIFVSRSSRGFVSFNLGQLPGDLVEITSASVHARQFDSQIGAYGPTTGDVRIQSLTYGGLSSNDFYKDAHKLCAVICFGSAPDSRLFSDNPLDGWKSADMSLAVRKDWNDRENRNYLSQFRLRYETECFDSNQVCGPVAGVIFYSSNANNLSGKPYLQVAYLIP